ncbi:hypothetical protein AGMMS50267_03420 [Spirochaetia bacterium]|nr:hypothetical protein AGMMS50267_03420 [Spirochaetia bacterium]
MTTEDQFLDDIAKDLAALRTKLENRRVKLHTEMKLFWEQGEQTARSHELGDLVDRINFVSEHLYLSGEYLNGNGEWAMLQEEDTDPELDFLIQAMA